jgi:hypothetical protein
MKFSALACVHAAVEKADDDPAQKGARMWKEGQNVKAAENELDSINADIVALSSRLPTTRRKSATNTIPRHSHLKSSSICP